MAITEKGIYYPTDYTKVADVPADFKQLAESADKAIGNIPEYNDKPVKEDIRNLKENDEQQDKDIETLQTKQTELETEIEELEKDIQANAIIEETEQAKSLYIDDASGARGSLIIEGNAEQDGEANPQHPSEIKVLKAGSTKIKNINKNFFDKENIQYYNNNSALFENTSNTNTTRLRTNSFELREGNYILSGLSNNIKLTAVRAYNNQKELIDDGVTRSNNNFTLKPGIEYIHLLFSHSDNSDISEEEIKELKLQIEAGNIETSYIEHQEISCILDIQQDMLKDDKFDLNTKKETHNWKKIIFKGNEQWYFYSGSAAPFGIYISDLVLPASQQDMPEVICTQYKACKWAEVSTSGDYLVSNPGGANFLRFRDIDCSTLDEFKARLAEKYSNGTPVELWYKSTQKIELDLTDAQIEVLEKLSKLRFYKGVNNIFTTEDIALLQAKYSVDLKSTNNKMQKEINEIKELLSTTQTSAMLLDNLEKNLIEEVK